MKTLKVTDGDLVLSSGSYVEVSGRDKLVQDISMALGEPLGVDRFHPRWGGLLPSMVGTVSNGETLLKVEGEVMRVVSNYVAVQRDRMAQDKLSGRRNLYDLDELVSSVSDIRVRQEMDRLHILVTIATEAGGPVTLISTVGI